MIVKRCVNEYTWIWDKHIPLGAWYGQDAQGWFFCTQHAKSDDNSLTLYRLNGTRWVKGVECTRTTRVVCAWAEQHGLWWTKCHWFKEEDKKIRCVTKHDSYIKRYENMMKHDKKHKKSGSGIRLDKENYYASVTFTDYECSNRPLHDFRTY